MFLSVYFKKISELPVIIVNTIFFFSFFIGAVSILLMLWSSFSGCPRCGYTLFLRTKIDEKTGVIYTYANAFPPRKCENCGLDLTKSYKK